MVESKTDSGGDRALVSIARLGSYDPSAVDRAMEELLAPLGGMNAIVRPGCQVVLKPNMLRPSSVESAVCTHPEIIRATARLARGAGAGIVEVTDSPGVGTAKICAARLGLSSGDLLVVKGPGEGLEVEAPAGSTYPKLKVSDRIRDAEVLINLPKAKTHGQMVMTCAVKNSFGAVIGLEKPQWHLRAGRDPMSFAKLLVQIHSLVSPKLNVLDAVVGMEGNGPGSGDPRPLGLLMASTNAHALDSVFFGILGLGERDVFTLRAARELGLMPPPEKIDVVGEDPNEFKPVPAWKMARPSSLQRLTSVRWVGSLADHLISVRPEVDGAKCTACGQCRESCAADAISFEKEKRSGKEIACIDRDLCISCFCCQEVCPEGAITVSAGVLARIMGLGPRS